MHARLLLLLAFSVPLLAGNSFSAQTPKPRQTLPKGMSEPYSSVNTINPIIPVGDEDNEKTIMLPSNGYLVVALDSEPSTGYSWNLLTDAGSPLALTRPPYYKPFPRKRGAQAPVASPHTNSISLNPPLTPAHFTCASYCCAPSTRTSVMPNFGRSKSPFPPPREK